MLTSETDQNHRLVSDIADLKSSFDSFRATLPDTYIPRREYDARWANQDRMFDAINAKLDKLIDKSDDTSPQLATAIQRISTVENELTTLRMWMRTSLTTAVTSLVMFLLQLYLMFRK